MALFAITQLSDLEGRLSDKGARILSKAWESNDGTRVVYCVSHPRKELAAMFKKETDVDVVFSKSKILAESAARDETQGEDWQKPMTEDL